MYRLAARVALAAPLVRGARPARAAGAPARARASAAAAAGAAEGRDGAPLRSARLRVPGARADDLSECLLSLGAISVTVEDANAGTEAEQAIARGPANWLSMGSSSGEAMREQLWDASTLRFFFTPGEVGGEDGGASELVTMACDACGLSPVPAVEVTDDDCQVGDWWQDVQEDAGASEPLIDAQQCWADAFCGEQVEDWVKAIKATYVPNEAAPGVWIVPDFGEGAAPGEEQAAPFEPPAGAVKVALQPGVAFGTGEHPTTRLCLATLAAGGRAAVRAGDEVLDYGAGSGVLALLALRLGATRAVGVDIDPMAVSSAKTNAALNGFDETNFRCYEVDPEDDAARPLAAEDDDSFDMVVANILQGPLLDLEARLASYARPGARLVLSGVLAGEQAAAVVEKYGEHFEGMAVAEEDGWACVTGVRRQ